jgi:protease II
MRINRALASVFLALFALAALSLVAQQALLPPVAPQLDHKEVRHGETVVDPYFWLREKTNPEVTEYLEWGNPNEKAAYDYMKSYSPYDNLAPKAYPAILVTTSFNDSQVMYWGPVKYVARLRTLKTDKNELLLKIKMEPAGHGGASGRYDKLRDTAFEYAWMLKQAGINH